MAKTRKAAAYALAITLGLGLLSSASVVSADVRNQEEPTAGEMFADAVLVRPMTAAVSVVGAIAWVVTLPFTLPSESMEESARSWVADPLEYTFMRPLGDMEDNRDK